MSQSALRPTRLTIDRNLARALAISLLIHGLALGPTPQPPTSGQHAVPLEAILRPAPDAATTTAAPKAPPVIQAPTAPSVSAPPVHHAHPKPVEHTYATPVERTYEKPTGTAPVAGAAPAPEAANPAPATEGASSQKEAATAPAAEAAPVQPVRPGVDLGGLRQYHLSLGRMAARFRIYPPRARAAGWEGRVPVRIAVSAGGQPMDLTLLGTSGHPLLDQAALELMRLAAEHTPVPESLRGRAFTIDLAVEYNLRDD